MNRQLFVPIRSEVDHSLYIWGFGMRLGILMFFRFLCKNGSRYRNSRYNKPCSPILKECRTVRIMIVQLKIVTNSAIF